MDISKIKEIAATIQSILVSLAIVSGGVWALITLAPYWEAKLVSEKVSPSILVTMTVDQEKLPGDVTGKKTVLVEVTTTNTGGHTVSYNFAKRALLITQQIPLDGENTFQKGKVYDGKFMGEENPPAFGKLAPGGKITYQYAALVDDPGLYSVLFKAIPEGTKDEESFYYAARKLIVVN